MIKYFGLLFLRFFSLNIIQLDLALEPDQKPEPHHGIPEKGLKKGLENEVSSEKAWKISGK